MALDASFMLSQAWLEGSLGGLCLGLGRMLVTFVKMDHSRSEHKYGRFIAAHLIAALLFALLGGAVTWAVEGRAGNFAQGVGAMLLLGLLAGHLMPDWSEPENTPTTSTTDSTAGGTR